MMTRDRTESPAAVKKETRPEKWGLWRASPSASADSSSELQIVCLDMMCQTWLVCTLVASRVVVRRGDAVGSTRLQHTPEENVQHNIISMISKTGNIIQIVVS